METSVADIKIRRKRDANSFLSSLKISYHSKRKEEIALINVYIKAKLHNEKVNSFDAPGNKNE